MPGFIDQTERLRRIVSSSIEGCRLVEYAPEEGGRQVLLRARRGDGRAVNLRFRGVQKSELTAAPRPGDELRLKSLSSGDRLGLLRMLLPFLRSFPPGGVAGARVRIDAGEARMEIVCQDAEWWEDEPTPDRPPEAQA